MVLGNRMFTFRVSEAINDESIVAYEVCVGSLVEMNQVHSSELTSGKLDR